jgi:hypothetical protein
MLTQLYRFPDHPIILPIFGFLFSMPCFWIVIKHPAYQQAGRFILLTYVRQALSIRPDTDIWICRT